MQIKFAPGIAISIKQRADRGDVCALLAYTAKPCDSKSNGNYRENDESTWIVVDAEQTEEKEKRNTNDTNKCYSSDTIARTTTTTIA